MNDRPLIVQGDSTLLLEVASPVYPQVRDALARFAELVKSPEHMHTYRLSALSLWNAAASGLPAEAVVETLHTYSRYPVPPHVVRELEELFTGTMKL